MNATSLEKNGPGAARPYAAAGPSAHSRLDRSESRRDKDQPMGKCNCRRWGDVVDVSQYAPRCNRAWRF